VQSGTTTELNLADWFKANGLEFTPVVFEKPDEVNAAYESGRCDVFTTDQSGLYAYRLTFQNPGEHVVLPEIISKEPLGPLVRQGDYQWFNIVKWTHFALIEAEEYGITQANVEEMKASENPTTIGSSISSRASETTARFLSAMSARAHRSRSSAA
jgi:general L-amino acid transport system substrate-binding protein